MCIEREGQTLRGVCETGRVDGYVELGSGRVSVAMLRDAPACVYLPALTGLSADELVERLRRWAGTEGLPYGVDVDAVARSLSAGCE